MMTRFYIQITTLLLGFCGYSTSCIAQPIQEINGLKYQVLSGLAEVTSIRIVKSAAESDLGYDEHEVKFKFVPMEKGQEVLKILEHKKLDLTLKYGSSHVLVGPAYIKKMSLKVGRKYAMNLFQTQTVNLKSSPYFYQSKALEDNLFLAYEDVIDGLVALFNLVDSNAILTEASTVHLTATEQRALIDAQLKNGLKNGDFTNSKFSPKAFEYLKEHSQLLQEYEAALAALSKMEEDKKILSEKEKEKKSNHNQNGISIENTDLTTSPQSKIFRGCYYEVIPGLAEITSIKISKKASESPWKYDEHEVLFKFIPTEGHELLDKLKDSNLEFVLHYRGNKIQVGPSYIQQKGLSEGARYQMILYQKREEGICEEQYSYESPVLDNDLFEALPPKPYFAAFRERNNSE